MIEAAGNGIDGHQVNGHADDGGDDQAEASGGWSVNRLARELRLDRRTVSKRLHNVEPIAEGAKGPLYDLADAARALFGATTQREVDELQRRMMQAKAEAAELELAEKRDQLVRRDQVEAAASSNARMEREALLNWPERAAPAFAAELGVDQANAVRVLEQELRIFMEERAADDSLGE